MQRKKITKPTSRVRGTKKQRAMTTTNNNGLNYTTKRINKDFRIKVYGTFNGKKVNKLVGVKGLIEMVGDVELVNKMLRRSYDSKEDKTVCKLRRGVKITFYCK